MFRVTPTTLGSGNSSRRVTTASPHPAVHTSHRRATQGSHHRHSGGGGVRLNMSGVSERPRAGSRYPPHPVGTSTTDDDIRWWRDFGAVPGGRRLWCRLVVVFTFVSLFGVGFIFLGAAFIHQAYAIYKDKHLSLPLTWCIVGIVSGTLMVLGSIVLGRFIISDKWRKNQQPTYPSMAPRPPARVRYTTNNNAPESEADVQIDFPPPYEASNLPPIFIVTGRNVALTLPPPSTDIPKPPSYTECGDLPPKYSEIDATATPNNSQTHRNTHQQANVNIQSADIVRSGRHRRNSQADNSRSEQNISSSTRPTPSSSCNRIEVITVVSTREDPPPYEGPPPNSSPQATSIASVHGPRTACTVNSNTSTEQMSAWMDSSR